MSDLDDLIAMRRVTAAEIRRDRRRVGSRHANIRRRWLLADLDVAIAAQVRGAELVDGLSLRELAYRWGIGMDLARTLVRGDAALADRSGGAWRVRSGSLARLEVRAGATWAPSTAAPRRATAKTVAALDADLARADRRLAVLRGGRR
ncbi:MAG: hypothetical protein R2939_22330 [Kofleriaceae bacterium]